MAENVREVIRAAQAAELGGDKPRAIELLRQAAALYQRGGQLGRAEQLLRYALRLDPSRSDVEAEIARLERASSVTREEPPPSPAPPSLSSSFGEDDEDDGESRHWVIEEGSSTSLEEALREAELAVSLRMDPVATAAEVVRAAVISVAEVPVPPVVPSVEPLAETRVEPGGVQSPHPSPLPEGEGAFIERGPTRADPSLEAWCSFCCRPRSEVGPLVAGPAGAFICSACIGESSSLLGGVAPVVPPARSSAPSRVSSVLELVGQEAAREGLARALEAGVRRVLVLGPEGSGKSTWLRALEEQGRGVIVTPDSLDQASIEAVLLVEDVDRLAPSAQVSLASFLARHPERTVLMTSRGDPVSPGPVLLSDSGRLPVFSTSSLAEAVQGSLPLALLEQVQSLVTLEPPGVEDLVEIARRLLASREDRHLSEEALAALASEAARSPRAGHELRALLNRVPPGSWRLELKKPKPARRVRRKGRS